MTNDELLALLPGLKAILDKYPGWLDEAVNTAEASRITGTPVETLTTMPVASKCGLSVVMVTTLVVRDQLTPSSVALVSVSVLGVPRLA